MQEKERLKSEALDQVKAPAATHKRDDDDESIMEWPVVPGDLRKSLQENRRLKAGNPEQAETTEDPDVLENPEKLEQCMDAPVKPSKRNPTKALRSLLNIAKISRHPRKDGKS